MARRIRTLVLLFCLIMSTTAFFGLDDDDDNGDDDEDDFFEYNNDDNGNGNGDAEAGDAGDGDDSLGDEDSGNSTDGTLKRTWFCPRGWKSFSADGHVSCVWLSNFSANFNDALSHCHDLKGGLVSITSPEKNKFIKAAVFKEEKDFWIGLSKGRGYDTHFRWHTKTGTVYAESYQLPEQIREYLSYKGQCVTISSYSEDWDMDDCDSEYNFVCEREIECVPGTFGQKCEKECHCAGEPCDPSLANQGAVTCKWGCERNWMGQACDKQKEDPEVKYFCINTPGQAGAYVYIRIYTKGVQYRSIKGLNADKSPGRWCNGTWTSPFAKPYDLSIINIPVNNDTIEQMKNGECVGEQSDTNVFSWAISIQENEGILLEHDLQVFITCDFNNAEKLVRRDKYDTKGAPAHVHQSSVSPESIAQDVLLEVIDAYTGLPVTEAPIGTTVVLQMKYGLQSGSVLKGVFPYNCVAMSPDEKYKKRLIDVSGCQERGSPVSNFKADRDDGHSVRTPWFNLFGFENEQNVVFQCSFGLCFEDDCYIGCAPYYDASKARMRRDTTGETNELKHSTTRTIRVLPSISPNRGQEAKPESTRDNRRTRMDSPTSPGSASSDHQMAPFLYVNPVTCGLFLLLLVVFLCMYIAFLRTLRSSINEVRKEIEIKRSRDKFLNCGCPTQQKDRACIMPM